MLEVMRIRRLFFDENSWSFGIPLKTNWYFKEKNTNRKKISGGHRFFSNFCLKKYPGIFSMYLRGSPIKNDALLKMILFMRKYITNIIPEV